MLVTHMLSFKERDVDQPRQRELTHCGLVTIFPVTILVTLSVVVRKGANSPGITEVGVGWHWWEASNNRASGGLDDRDDQRN